MQRERTGRRVSMHIELHRYRTNMHRQRMGHRADMHRECVGCRVNMHRECMGCRAKCRGRANFRLEMQGSRLFFVFGNLLQHAKMLATPEGRASCPDKIGKVS